MGSDLARVPVSHPLPQPWRKPACPLPEAAESLPWTHSRGHSSCSTRGKPGTLGGATSAPISEKDQQRHVTLVHWGQGHTGRSWHHVLGPTPHGSPPVLGEQAELPLPGQRAGLRTTSVSDQRPHSPTGRILMFRKDCPLLRLGPGSSGGGAIMEGWRALGGGGNRQETGLAWVTSWGQPPAGGRKKPL